MMFRLVLAGLMTVAGFGVGLAQTAAAITVAEALQAAEDQPVNIAGTVTRFQSAWGDSAPNYMTVSDATGEVNVAIWPAQMTGLARNPASGASVSVAGIRKTQQGCALISVLRSEDVSFSNASSGAVASPVSAIGKAMIGQSVVIEGTVAALRPSWKATAPNIFTINDGGASITAVIWPGDYAKVQAKPVVGSAVRLRGVVDEYNGSLQIRIEAFEPTAPVAQAAPNPAMAAAAPVVEPAAKPAAKGTPPTFEEIGGLLTGIVGRDNLPPQTRPTPVPSPSGVRMKVATIRSSMKGTQVSLTGRIDEVRPSVDEIEPYRVLLDDNTGKIALSISPGNYARIPHMFVQGREITAKGRIDIVRGEVLLNIAAPNDVLFMDVASAY